MNNLITQLQEIFENNKDKRICVLGTTCTGKTTILNQIKIGVDMDEIVFPLLTPEEKDYVCQSPWTKEIGNKMDELVREKVKINKGTPVFGTVLIECDLIIYLNISDALLLERTNLRNADFTNAKNMKLKIEEELQRTDIPVITINID